MSVKYLQLQQVQEVKVQENPNASRYYHRSGYFSKLPTRYMIRIEKRWHRVYAQCFSNSGISYVLIKKELYIVRDELLESVRH